MTTDTQDLIARLRLGASISRDRNLNADAIKITEEAADKLEALRAENERLERSFSGMADLAKEAADERDAALARLAELQKQEPVAEVTNYPTMGVSFTEATDYGCALKKGTKLYAAAGASSVEPAQPQGCACRWDAEDNRVATCTRHQGWLDVVSEWADRAKAAEAKLAQPSQAGELSNSDVWANEEIMSLNAEAGLEMSLLVKIVNAAINAKESGK